MRGRLRRALDELAVTIGRTAQVVAQARSRLAGQMPDSATRLVSLHDPDARPIRKGRIGRPVEFGCKAAPAWTASKVPPSGADTAYSPTTWSRSAPWPHNPGHDQGPGSPRAGSQPQTSQ